MHTNSLSQVRLLGPCSHKIFSKSHKGYSSINNSASLYVPQNIFSAALVDKAPRFHSYVGMTINEIRKEKLEELISKYGSLRALAVKLDHSATAQISQWRQSSPDSRTGKPRTISDRSARTIEIKCGKEIGWMDQQAAPKTSVITSEPSELGTLWALLIPSERDELLTQIRRKAAHNKAVMSLMKGGQVAEISQPLGGRSFINKLELSNELNERRLSAARERRQQARAVEIERRIKNRREEE